MQALKAFARPTFMHYIKLIAPRLHTFMPRPKAICVWIKNASSLRIKSK